MSAEVLGGSMHRILMHRSARYLVPPNTPQAEAPRKWAPHSIIAHFPPAVNRQIAQTFNPKIVHSDETFVKMTNDFLEQNFCAICLLTWQSAQTAAAFFMQPAQDPFVHFDERFCRTKFLCILPVDIAE